MKLGREQSDKGVADVGDAGVAEEEVSADFSEAERLKALPWVRFCLKHQTLLEAPGGQRFPTM